MGSFRSYKYPNIYYIFRISEAMTRSAILLACVAILLAVTCHVDAIAIGGAIGAGTRTDVTNCGGLLNPCKSETVSQETQNTLAGRVLGNFGGSSSGSSSNNVQSLNSLFGAGKK